MIDNLDSSPTGNTITHHLGILGGTFDPIHYGHIKPALDAADLLALDKVLVMPAHIPPHKQSTHANAQQRLTMTKLACEPYPQLVPDSRELERSKVSYTVDTLSEIKQQHPSTTLYFMMGMDSLLSFTQWHRWQEILTLCHLVVATRPNYRLDLAKNGLDASLAKRVKTHAEVKHTAKQTQQKQQGSIILITNQSVDISSTEIRLAIKSGEDISAFLPSDVHQYIQQQNLYQN